MIPHPKEFLSSVEVVEITDEKVWEEFCLRQSQLDSHFLETEPGGFSDFFTETERLPLEENVDFTINENFDNTVEDDGSQTK